MNQVKIWTISQKEFRDTFRDISTVFSVFVLPVVLYPAMFIGMGLLIGQQQRGETRRVSQIVLAGELRDSALVAALRTDPKIVLPVLQDPEHELQDGVIQAVVKFDVESGVRPERLSVTVLYDQSRRNSVVAQKRIKQIIDTYQHKMVISRMINQGIDTMLVQPVQAEYRNVASDKKMGGFILGMIIPYMIIMLAFLGAMHTAMDITAGEKERKTIETLLVSDVSRNQIVAGKLLTVVCMGLLTAFMGLLSLGLTAMSGVSILSAQGKLSASMSISPVAMLLAFLTLLPCSMLMSSLLLLIGSFARSVKEGSAYGAYLLMGVLMLTLVSITPMEPPPALFIIPVLNTALCLKELLMGTYNWGHLGVALATTGMAALAAIGVTVAMFSQERILFRS